MFTFNPYVRGVPSALLLAGLEAEHAELAGTMLMVSISELLSAFEPALHAVSGSMAQRPEDDVHR